MANSEILDNREHSVSLGYVFYTQVAGVLGAFSLAAFAGDYFDLGWRGLLLNLIAGWDHYVRPVTSWLLDIAIVSPLRTYFHITLVIPLVARDYISVGLILCLSWVRAARWAHAHFVQTAIAITHNPEKADIEEMIEAEEEVLVEEVGKVRYVLRLITNVLFWPLALVSVVMTPFLSKWKNRLDRIAIIQTALTVSPLFYFGLLYAANVWVVRG